MKKLNIVVAGLLMSGMLYATDYGLVVGCCGKYKILDNNLKGTANDAKAFAKILQRSCSKKNIKLLINSDATKANIKAQLLKIEEKLNLKDTLYFYFSGHGAKAGDKQVFMKEIDDDDDLNGRLNETALIPYDYNPKNSYNSSIITSKDLMPIFKRLDTKGVKIVMFADACFAGESFRSTVQDRIKRLMGVQNQKVKRVKSTKTQYKNLIFFGASLNATQAREIDTKYGKRGEFSIYLEYCFNNGDSNGDKKISKAELHQCMRDEFASYARKSSVYPISRLGSRTIIRAKVANVVRDRTLPKVKYSGKVKLSGIVNLVKTGYELEVLQNGGVYDIYKAGVLYASVEKSQLAKYLKAYRLFGLKSKESLSINYVSDITNKREDTYCAGETINISVENMKNNYMMVLSLDKNGRVIMMKSNGSRSQTKVFPPYNGVDRVKIFTYNSKKAYELAKVYEAVNSGILSTKNINRLYGLLSKDKSLREQTFSVRTTSNTLKQCTQGGRR